MTATIELDDRTQTAVRYHLRTAAAVLQCALSGLQRNDRDVAEGVAALIQGGSLVSLRVTLSQAGLAHLGIEVATPAGDMETLLSCELQQLQ